MPITDSHCRELIDNVVDMAHFYYVHFSFPTSFRNVFEGHTATQFMESKGRPDMGGGGYGDADLFLKSEATYYGPSYMINWLDVDYKGFETEVILINCHIPTGPDSFTLQYGITRQEARGPRRRRPPHYIAKKYAKMFGEGFLQDVHIWKNKVPVQNPLLCEEDGPVYQLRRWYEQFYVDQADVVPGDGRPVRVRGRHHQGQRVLAGGGRREPRAEGRGGRRRASAATAGDRRTPDGLLRPHQRETLEDQRLYTQRAAGRGRLPGLPRAGRGEEEQRAPHLDPVDRPRRCAHCPEFASSPRGPAAAASTRPARG